MPTDPLPVRREPPQPEEALAEIALEYWPNESMPNEEPSDWFIAALREAWNAGAEARDLAGRLQTLEQEFLDQASGDVSHPLYTAAEKLHHLADRVGAPGGGVSPDLIAKLEKLVEPDYVFRAVETEMLRDILTVLRAGGVSDSKK